MYVEKSTTCLRFDMSDVGGQPGNQNAARGRVWRDAINRALENRSRVDQVHALDVLAEKLLAKCDEGDMQALKELGDRIEGKPAQPISGDEENPVRFISRVERVIVDRSKD